MIDVDADVRVVSREDVADAGEAVGLSRRQRLLQRGPCSRIGSAGKGAAARVDRELSQLPVARLQAPRDPLARGVELAGDVLDIDGDSGGCHVGTPPLRSATSSRITATS